MLILDLLLSQSEVAIKNFAFILYKIKTKYVHKIVKMRELDKNKLFT